MHLSRVAEVWRIIIAVSLDVSQIRQYAGCRHLQMHSHGAAWCVMLKEGPTFLVWGL